MKQTFTNRGLEMSRWALGLAVMASFGFLPASACHGTTPETVVGPDGSKRVLQHCELEFSVETQRIESSVNWLGVGVSASTEKKALQQLSDSTKNYLLQSKKLCEAYNGFAISQSSYERESAVLRARLAGIPEQYASVNNATSDEDRREQLGRSYGSIVPADERVELSLDFAVLAKRPGGANEAPLAQNAPLPTDSRVRFLVRTSARSHVYIFQQAPDGKINVLFPDARLSLANPVSPGQVITIPPGGASYRVNDKDIGLEKVYVTTSLAAVQSLAVAAAQAKDGAADPNALAMLTAVQTDSPSSGGCKTRALELDPGAPVATCVRSRGLELAPAPAGTTGSEYSFSARTEAADGTIVKVFAFNHTP